MESSTTVQRVASRAAINSMIAWLRGIFGRTARKSVLSMVDQAVYSGSNFLTTIVVGRFCGLEQLGVYSLGFAVVVVAAVLHEAFIWTPYTVFRYRRGEDTQAEYTGSALVMQALMTALGMLLLAVAATLAPYVSAAPPKLVSVIGILVWTLPLYLFRDFVRRLLLAQLRVLQTLAIDVSVLAIQVGAFSALVWHGTLSVATAFLAVGFACAVVSLTWLALTSSRFAVRWKAVVPDVRAHWFLGRWLGASQLTDVGQNYAIHLILSVRLGMSATGIYAACASVVQIFNPLILGVGSVTAPRAAHVHAAAGVSDLRRVVGKATALLVAAAAVLCVGLSLYGETVLPVLFGRHEYRGQGQLITLLAVSTALFACGFAPSQGLWVLDRTDVNFKSKLAGLFAVALAAWWLTVPWGVAGAAYGRLIGLGLAAGVQCVAFLRLSRGTTIPGGNP
jgi:O-antigen/teichoic acid export membrane protein